MSADKFQLILGSQSPRRRELLEKMGLSFKVFVQDYDEAIDPTLAPEDQVQQLAYKKSKFLWPGLKNPNTFLITADTLVFVDEKILGKPANAEEALKSLSLLSGRSHNVMTGVCLSHNKNGEFIKKTFVGVTEVEFYPLEKSDIINYIKSGEPMDKAGAYGIQGLGALFVKGIHGSYQNIVGLDCARLKREMADFVKAEDNFRDLFL